jgi:hypothetical protein
MNHKKGKRKRKKMDFSNLARWRTTKRLEEKELSWLRHVSQ